MFFNHLVEKCSLRYLPELKFFDLDSTPQDSSRSLLVRSLGSFDESKYAPTYVLNNVLGT